MLNVTNVDCDSSRDLCHARTGVAIAFADESTGRVTTRRWDFGDGTVSRSQNPRHAFREPGFYEVRLEVGDGEETSTASRILLVEAAEPRGACLSDAETLCLRDSLFAVNVDWFAGDGSTSAARVVPAGTNESGLFAFFDSRNWEVLVKVLDGCADNGRLWVFGAATTDLGYALRIRDTVTGEEKVYRNEPGTPASAVADTDAFSDACPAE